LTPGKSVSILGSTGSVGRNVLDVIRGSEGRFSVVGLAAGRNIELLRDQVREFKPELVAVLDPGDAGALRALPECVGVKVLHGKEGYKAVASVGGADMVVSAMVGAAGLIPTIAALEAGKDVALANKETLVTAGLLVTDLAREKGAAILPVDSEHSAVFQCIQGHRTVDVRRIILTASGGPFRSRAPKDLEGVTAEEAVRHPNWSMGAKISVDSATLMNKGLEVIEARWLFDVDVSRIDVVVHPQSIVHSMVEYIDGSVIAQLGIPDMRVPIAYALAWPERIPVDLPSLDLIHAGRLTFEAPRTDVFPCLNLAYKAAQRGGTAPTALNAANEVAVDAFVQGRITFGAIARVVGSVLHELHVEQITGLDDVLRADALARLKADHLIYEMTSVTTGVGDGAAGDKTT
jgi:1-deoxy-D-xylulose-5-phosphate reductoisomerase